MRTESEFATLETRASPDRMEVSLAGHLSLETARAFDVDSLKKLLEDRGFKAYLDRDRATQVCRQLRSGRTLPPQVVAWGVSPLDGEDGRVELHFSDAIGAGEKHDDSGRIDYHTRSLVKAVRAGQLLLRIVEPTNGSPGVDVHGRVVPAKDGAPKTVQAGKNVSASPDGGELYALKDGAIVFKGGTISVVDTVVIDSDVDYATGNIAMPFGSVEIRGNVTSGFCVTCGKDIAVRDVVEDAFLTAGGNIEIRGGVTAKEAGLIKAGGHFSARYLHNARLEVDKEVHLADGAVQSAIYAGGQIVAVKGKGRVSGGVLKSRVHIEVNEAGAATGVMTRLEIETHTSHGSHLTKMLEALQKERESLKRTLGESSDEAVLGRTSALERDELENLLARRRFVQKRIAKVEHALHEEQQRHLMDCLKRRIVVRRQIHPGVVIAIAGRLAEVTQGHGPCHFYLDIHTNRIVCAPGEGTTQDREQTPSSADAPGPTLTGRG